jgi:hypothetical protein
MQRFGLGFLLIATLLSGCDRTPATSQTIHHGGRYLGIGIYQASDLWQHMIAAARPADATAATVRDASQVIVVVDSNSGEIRQCGNMSGHCIGMNPWATTLGRGQAAPVALNVHADDILREAQEADADHSAVNATRPETPAPARRR